MRAFLPDLLTEIPVQSCGCCECGALRCPSALDTCWGQAGIATLDIGAGDAAYGCIAVVGERCKPRNAMWVIRSGHGGLWDEAPGPGRWFAKSDPRARLGVAQPSFGPRPLLTVPELLERRR